MIKGSAGSSDIWWVILISGVLLGIHLGVNEFISVQFISFLILFCFSVANTPSDRRMVQMVAVIVFIHLAATLLAGHDEHYYLKALRVSLVMVVIFRFSVWASSISDPRLLLKRIELSLFVVGLVSCAIGGAQLFDSLIFNSGVFDIPEEWFALDYGTLFSSQRATLAGVGFFIRPSGLFSEPSALSFSALIGFYCGKMLISRRLVLISVITVFVSMSLSGIIILLVFYIYFSIRNRRGQGFGWMVVAAALVISFIPFMIFLFGDRFSEMASGGDASTNIRLGEPLRILGKMFDNGEYLGLPLEVIESHMSSDVLKVDDNWVISQFLLYGVFGFVLIGLLFVVFNIEFLVAFLPLSMINGDVFYYDRAVYFVVLLSVICFCFRIDFDGRAVE